MKVVQTAERTIVTESGKELNLNYILYQHDNGEDFRLSLRQTGDGLEEQETFRMLPTPVCDAHSQFRAVSEREVTLQHMPYILQDLSYCD